MLSHLWIPKINPKMHFLKHLHIVGKASVYCWYIDLLVFIILHLMIMKEIGLFFLVSLSGLGVKYILAVHNNPALWEISYMISVAETTRRPPCFVSFSFSIIEWLAVYRTTEMRDSRSQSFVKLGMAMRCKHECRGRFLGSSLRISRHKISAPTWSLPLLCVLEFKCRLLIPEGLGWGPEDGRGWAGRIMNAQEFHRANQTWTTYFCWIFMWAWNKLVYLLA